ncbi:uncharacterized protein si:ch211-227n13.3 isoform X2 [Sardina pilchardus]|uniref:uncharacterized protein si:ch211-227n13.3 isoform X2 n=1 Tax=Sardina pilchardus TaxID=27697 RepID=UPI002E0F8122
MSALTLFDGEHHETSQHNITRRMRRTRREVDGTLKVECVMEEVEIRRNVKHLIMKQSKAADHCQTNGGSLSRPFKKRFGSKILLDDEGPESDQDYFGGHDLIDLINSPHSRHDGWTKSRESPMLGLNGDSPPVTRSLVLLSDGDESDAARSDAESAEIILGSENDDDERLNLSVSQYSGPDVSPELSTTPLSLILSLSKSQEPSASSGAEASLKFMSGSRSENSVLLTGRRKEPPIAIGSEDEDFVDGNVSDSCCSIASGPSKLWQPAPQGPCSSCLALCVRMKRLTNWTKSRVKDPACLCYDQWLLLKPWRPRGVRGLRRVRGKLFEHLPRIWQHAKVRVEQDLDGEWEACTRPHVFLRRNFRQCQRSQSKPLNHTKVRNKAGSRRARRSKDAWPPVGQNVKQRKKKRNKSMEDSAKTKKKKTSAGEEQRSRGRREETSGTEEQRRDGQAPGDEHASHNDVTADCSTAERANSSPDRRQDVNADIQTNGCPDEHGNVRAPSPSEWPADANVGSPSHRHTDPCTGSSPGSREDRPGDLRADRHRDGHREKQRSNQRSVGKANAHAGVKAFKCVVGGGSDRDARKSADSVDRPTGSDVDVCLKRNADDQGRRLSNERRQGKSPPGDALSRHLGVNPNIHLNSPSSMNGDEVLDYSEGHLDINVDDSSDELEDSSTDKGLTRRALLFEDTPTLPLTSVSTPTPAVGSVRTRRHTLNKDPYAFRTPTPPGIEGSEVLRKPRPFARTYESAGARNDSFKSMLCMLDKMHSAVVSETVS